jgi:hypothetical protein
MKWNSIKQIFLFTIFSLALGVSNITHAQTDFGILAGMSYLDVMMKDENGDKISTKSIPGFRIGLMVDIPVATNFSFQPAALYCRKGFKQTDNWFSGSDNDFEVTVSYIEVPLIFMFKPRLGIGKLLIGTGPYAGYGTGGKWKSENNVLIGDIMIDNKGDVIFKNDVMDGEFGNYLYGKPWDFGVNLLAGYEFFGKLSLEFNTQLGINDLKPEVDGVRRDGRLRNNGYNISVGYKF